MQRVNMCPPCRKKRDIQLDRITAPYPTRTRTSLLSPQMQMLLSLNMSKEVVCRQAAQLNAAQWKIKVVLDWSKQTTILSQTQGAPQARPLQSICKTSASNLHNLKQAQTLSTTITLLRKSGTNR